MVSIMVSFLLMNQEIKQFNSYRILVWLWITWTLQRKLWKPEASTVPTELHDKRSDTGTLSALGRNWRRSSHVFFSMVWEVFHYSAKKIHVSLNRFLTLFTARFPLPFVFQVIDFFLLDGIQILIQVAFSLLLACKKDLLTKDFEATLKFIRISLPKKFRSGKIVQVDTKILFIKIKYFNYRKPSPKADSASQRMQNEEIETIRGRIFAEKGRKW